MNNQNVFNVFWFIVQIQISLMTSLAVRLHLSILGTVRIVMKACTFCFVAIII